MGFEKVVALESEVTVSLGGINKKTNKANPTQVEGYFLGSRQVVDLKKKSGFEFIHYFLTEEGNIGVWGKTNLNNGIKNVEIGCMTRVTSTGKTRPTPNGDMKLFDVEVDKSNRMDAADLPSIPADRSDEPADETALDEEETPADEVRPAYVSKPSAPAAQPPSAAQQSKVQALLNSRRKTG